MSHPLRVLQVVGKMDRAGAETLLMNLYRHFDRDKVQFDFLTHRKESGDYDEEIITLGGKIYRLCPMSVKNCFAYKRELKAFFWEYPGYKIIHSHIDAMSALPLAAAKRAGVPVRIAHSHNTDFPRDVKYPLRVAAKAMLPLAATHDFACSAEAARFLFPKHIFDSRDYTVLPNAIDLERFAFSPIEREKKRSELGIADTTFVLGHIGRFSAQKNHEKLLRIFLALHKQYPDSILLMVGQGELREQTVALSSRLGLQNAVRFLGVRTDIEELMQAFDLFLLPSLYEGFPVVGVEAQAAGLPCLMSDRIKRDAALIEPVEFVPLKADDMVWAKKALELRTLPRGNTTKRLADAGFDIEQQSGFLKEFYLTVAGM